MQDETPKVIQIPNSKSPPANPKQQSQACTKHLLVWKGREKPGAIDGQHDLLQGVIARISAFQPFRSQVFLQTFRSCFCRGAAPRRMILA
jgi:hypothetical protein